ncbi:hypothetical protein Btru_049448 [Bulinus truncatus]|nr:hypothetical protein Btru_049448 [Bulinus truncatus]
MSGCVIAQVRFPLTSATSTSFLLSRWNMKFKATQRRYSGCDEGGYKTAHATLSLSIRKDNIFVKKSALSCGPVILGTGWTDKSTVSCAINCINTYSIKCFSFMYNQETQLCTPGGQLSPSQSAPQSAEGDLYVLKRDDAYENFRLDTIKEKKMLAVIGIPLVKHGQFGLSVYSDWRFAPPLHQSTTYGTRPDRISLNSGQIRSKVVRSVVHLGLMTYGATTVYMAYYQTPLNYTQALDACKCLDSTLYVAKTTDKFNLFANLVNTVGNDTWIGLDDIANENQFVWVDDGQSFNWSYWSSYFQSDQPDNYMNEDCVEMHSSNLKLNDEQCANKFYFMCEKLHYVV